MKAVVEALLTTFVIFSQSHSTIYIYMCDYDDEETTPQCIEFIYINFGDKCKLELLPFPPHQFYYQPNQQFSVSCRCMHGPSCSFNKNVGHVM